MPTADEALQMREGPSGNGNEGGGRDVVGGGAEAGKKGCGWFGRGGGAGTQEWGGGGFEALRGAGELGVGAAGLEGEAHMQRERPAAAVQALQMREGPSGNGGEGGSKECGRGRSGRGQRNEKAWSTQLGKVWMVWEGGGSGAPGGARLCEAFRGAGGCGNRHTMIREGEGGVQFATKELKSVLFLFRF